MRHSSASPCSASSHAISHLPFSHSLLFPTLFRLHLLLYIHCKYLLMRMIEPNFYISSHLFLLFNGILPNPPLLPVRLALPILSLFIQLLHYSPWRPAFSPSKLALSSLPHPFLHLFLPRFYRKENLTIKQQTFFQKSFQKKIFCSFFYFHLSRYIFHYISFYIL